MTPRDTTSGPQIEQSAAYASFRFSRLKDHSKFGFGIFGKDIRKAKEAYEDLISAMQRLESEPLVSVLQWNKTQGIETKRCSEFHPSAEIMLKEIDIVSKDTKISIFRFGSDYRALCKQDTNDQSIFHLLAFDFNYSAYSH